MTEAASPGSAASGSARVPQTRGAWSALARRDSVVVGAVALALRLGVVAWAASRFPPTADGAYYHRIASRVARGDGYTWLWPDGAVTYAAHYPVGYPGAVGLSYAIFGPHPVVAMVLGAALGALAAVAVQRAAARYASRRRALAAGLLVAAHPGLLFYTPALMTEGVTAALVACAVWATAFAAERRSVRHLVPLGLVLGLATLVRPQSLALAPLLGALAWFGRGKRPAVAGAVVTLSVALAVCAPWTARNCARMGRCALVSVNGGWNLLIGADASATGAWSPVQVPPACREVWDEAQKDACFGAEALRFIRTRPLDWLAFVPKKLAATFDYCGAAGWYLHEANPEAMTERGKVVLGAVETVFERAALVAAIVAVAAARTIRSALARRGERLGACLRLALAVAAVGFALSVHAWVAYVALCALGASAPNRAAAAPGAVLPVATVLVVGATALTHAAFFGSGRYALVVMPLVTGLAAAGLAASRPQAPEPDRPGL